MDDEINNAEFLSAVLNAIPEPVFVKDEKHVFVFVNNAYSDFFGISKEKVLGKTDYDFYLKREVDVFWRRDNQVLKTGMANINEENYTDAQNVKHIIITRKDLYIDKNGKKFIVGIIRDVTRERGAEKIVEARTKELERMNKLMVDRENKMLELKHELSLLKQNNSDHAK